MLSKGVQFDAIDMKILCRVTNSKNIAGLSFMFKNRSTYYFLVFYKVTNQIVNKNYSVFHIVNFETFGTYLYITEIYIYIYIYNLIS